MNDKALTEERMRWIGDFDLFAIRVLEVGTKEWALTTRWITLTYGTFFSFGCGTGCWYD
jgi:hypothetical protein